MPRYIQSAIRIQYVDIALMKDNVFVLEQIETENRLELFILS
jgi:hypothetical protein